MTPRTHTFTFGTMECFGIRNALCDKIVLLENLNCSDDDILDSISDCRAMIAKIDKAMS